MDQELILKLADKMGFANIIVSDSINTVNLEDNISARDISVFNDDNYFDIRGYVQMGLSNILNPEEKTKSRDPIVRSKLKGILLRALLEKGFSLGESSIQHLLEELGNDLLGYGPIEPFFYDPEVTEIKANRYMVRIEKLGMEKIVPGISFRSEEHIRDVLERMLAPTGRKIDLANPVVNARDR
ncbi:MAG: hypothetical protein HGA27_07935, partial [Peptococcaceae bacterium]|nr:hypothetical protein [Peptococcaceae bacterium]